MDFIDLKTQYRRIERQVRDGFDAVLTTGNYVMGAPVAGLETRLAAYCGAGHCIAVANGTDALMLALMALDVRPGDEVITTPFSFFATTEAIVLLGATPVFVDIDPVTWNLDPGRLAAAITPRTRGILPVGLYGQCADMDAIAEVAAAHNLWVLEDAAQSFGATYNGRRSCNLARIACTSFYPAKPLGCYGDGGACFTSDDELAARLRCLRDHGQAGRYHHVAVGLNSRLDTLQAVVLHAKLDIFDDEIAARRQVADHYASALAANCPSVAPPPIMPGRSSVYAQYTVELPRRDAVQDAMKARGVPTAVHYPQALHMQPALASLGYRPGDFPAAEAAAARVLSLPMHPYLSANDAERIAQALRLSLAEVESLPLDSRHTVAG